MKTVFKGLGILILIIVGVLLVNTFTFTSKQVSYDPVATIDVGDDAIDRFRGAIKFRTISYGKPGLFDSVQFLGFHQYVSENFPLVDSLLEKQIVGGYTLLYKWKSASEKGPALIYSHFDVVPVDSATLDDWVASPFSGDILDDKIYGRGTLDDKCGVLGTLEAMERLLAEDFQPARTLYFGFGHDEEIGGENGAGSIVQYFQENDIRLTYSLDEGIPLIQGMIPGIEVPVAMVSTAEKGYVSYKLTINTPGGHSSSPAVDNTIGSLARAIVKLEENQFDYILEPVEQQLRYLGAEMPFIQKMIFANTWLTKNIILAPMNARTTTAPTMLEGGIKDNVIPTTASVVVNFRIMPGQTVQDVYDHIVEVVDDERLVLETVQESGSEPSAVASIETVGFKTIEKTLKQVFGDVVVTPALMPAGTDSKHFVKVADDSYRFNPAKINSIEDSGFHGLNEHIYIDAYKGAVQFYYQLIKNAE